MTLLTDGIGTILSAGAVALNTLTRELTGPAGSVKLDAAPFIVLRTLMRRPGAIVPVDDLISASWREPELEPAHPEDAIRARVCRAREALERVGAPRDQLALRFPRGYEFKGERRIVRLLTAAQAARVDQLLAAEA